MSPTQTPQQLLETMTQAGLVPEDKAKMLAERVTENTAVNTITNALVSRGVITELQEKLLLGEVDGSLMMGEYRLEKKIGSGGMGTVFKARHRVMDREVALKVLAPEMTQNPQQVQRFMREIKLVGKLHHANIVMAYDASEHNGIYYLVMELVEGEDLNSIVKTAGPMRVLQSMELIAQAADGFAYAHEKGIVHRDIKPANLLFATDGVIKILDLGIARLLSDASLTTQEGGGKDGDEMTLTSTGHLLGTVPYMAPEHAANPKDADHRSDIYSLGCTLYWLITGAFPYGGTTAVEMILASYRQPVPDLLELYEIPGRHTGPMREIQAVLSKMLAKKPDDRYQAMASVARDLRQLLTDHSKALADYRLVTQVSGQSEMSTQTIPPEQVKKEPAGTMPNRTFLEDLMSDTALVRTPKWQIWLKKPLAIVAGAGVVALIVLALLIYQLSGGDKEKEPNTKIVIQKVEVPVVLGTNEAETGTSKEGLTTVSETDSSEDQTAGNKQVETETEGADSKTIPDNKSGAESGAQSGTKLTSDSTSGKGTQLTVNVHESQESQESQEKHETNGTENHLTVVMPKPPIELPKKPPFKRPGEDNVSAEPTKQKMATNRKEDALNLVPTEVKRPRPVQVDLTTGLFIPDRLTQDEHPVDMIPEFEKKISWLQELPGTNFGHWQLRQNKYAKELVGVIPTKTFTSELHAKKVPATLQLNGQLPPYYRLVLLIQYADGKKQGLKDHVLGNYAVQFRLTNQFGRLTLTLDQRRGSNRFESTVRMLHPVTGKELQSSGNVTPVQGVLSHRYDKPIFSATSTPNSGAGLVIDVHPGHCNILWPSDRIMTLTFPYTTLPSAVWTKKKAVEIQASVPMKISMLRFTQLFAGRMPPVPPFRLSHPAPPGRSGPSGSTGPSGSRPSGPPSGPKGGRGPGQGKPGSGPRPPRPY